MYKDSQQKRALSVGARIGLVCAGLAIAGLIIAGVLLLLSPGIAPPPSAIGVWEAPEMHLSISPEGDIEYARFTETENGYSERMLNIKLQNWDAKGFDAGLWKLTTRFELQAPPHQTDWGEWRMTVDGVELTKIAP